MKKLTIIFFIIICSTADAQTDSRPDEQESIERILNDVSDDDAIQTLGEDLEHLRSHPVNITKPAYGELLRIPFVSPLLAESIVLLSDTVEISRIDQIKNAALMTDELFDKIAPFIISNSSVELGSLPKIVPSNIVSRHRMEKRLIPSKGFASEKFSGSPSGTYHRLKLFSEHLEIAVLSEKDAGEKQDDGFISGYTAAKDLSFVKTAVAGNFTVTSAQGLVFAKNISGGKGSNVVGQIRKRGSIISPTASTDEFRYFQGIASQINLSDLSLMGFYSLRKLPSSIDSDGIVTSFYTSGLYRTNADLQRKNNLEEKTIGGKMDYSFSSSAIISLTTMNVTYGNRIDRSLFDLSGKQDLSAGSLSWEIPFFRISTFGEIATNDAERFSGALGIIASIGKGASLSYHHRSYSKEYISPFARPFGERSSMWDGEKGNYLGLEARISGITFRMYVDHFILPSTSQHFDAVGTEALIHAETNLFRRCEIGVHIRTKEISQIGIRGADDVRRQINIRAGYKFRITREFSFAQRFEQVTVQYEPSSHSEKGLLTFIESAYKNDDLGFHLKARMVLFDTPSYDSRLYQYESDVPGNFSNPPMYGKGVRWYLISGYGLFDMFNVSFKYSETKKLNEIVLGSGDDEIQGNFDNSIALQLDFRF